MSKQRPLRLPGAPSLLIAGTLIYGFAPTKALAACVDTGPTANIRTCDATAPTTGRDHDFPSIDTLILQGGVSIASELLKKP